MRQPELCERASVTPVPKVDSRAASSNDSHTGLVPPDSDFDGEPEADEDGEAGEDSVGEGELDLTVPPPARASGASVPLPGTTSAQAVAPASTRATPASIRRVIGTPLLLIPRHGSPRAVSLRG